MILCQPREAATTSEAPEVPRGGKPASRTSGDCASKANHEQAPDQVLRSTQRTKQTAHKTDAPYESANGRCTQTWQPRQEPPVLTDGINAMGPHASPSGDGKGLGLG